MEKELLILGESAKEDLRKLRLEVVGLHYIVVKPAQRKRHGLFICFDAITHSVYFFGKCYENWRRVGLINRLYEILGNKLPTLFPNYKEILFDIHVYLKKPFDYKNMDEPRQLFPEGKFPDITQNNDVYYITLDSLLESGEVEIGSDFYNYCAKYDIKHISKHGRHHISPDTSSVEALEAICSFRKIKSVLEIGGGTGICGRAAERIGIKDYTFVDKSPVVCEYLRKNFSYAVIKADAFSFDFNRHWDLVLTGLPYELNPWFLSKKGAEIRDRSDIVFFQSGCVCFFEFEHDWIAGKKVSFELWPWWNKSQTLSNYFPKVFGCRFGWQTGIIGHKEEGDKLKLINLENVFTRQGFETIRYSELPLT